MTVEFLKLIETLFKNGFDVQTVAYIVVDVVGVIIIFFIFKWLFTKHYDKVVNKELEEFKSGLDKKNYVTKTKFDLELKIYLEISKMINETFMKGQDLIVDTLQDGKNENTKKQRKEIFKYMYNLSTYVNGNIILINYDVLEYINEYKETYRILLNKLDKIENGDERYKSTEIINFIDTIGMNDELNELFIDLNNSYNKINNAMSDVLNSYEIIK